MSTDAADHLAKLPVTRDPIGDIAVDPAGSTLVVTHPRISAVSILDADTRDAASLIALHGDPVAVAVAAGRAFVATTSASYDAVYVVDLETKALLSAHPLEFAITSMAVSPDGAQVFAARTGRLGNDVAVVDIATNGVTSLAIAARDAMTIDAVRAGGSRLLYAGVSRPHDGELVVIDRAEGRVTATLPVGAPIRDVALSPDGAVAYVLTHHPCVAVVIRIELARNAIGAVIQVSDSATQVAVSPDGALLYVVELNGVAVISAATGEVVDHITVGERPSCVAASPYTGRLYLADYAGVLIGLPAVTRAPATPRLPEALPALIAHWAIELQSVAV